ncbi:MAG: cell envelope integrity protein CreD [Betaproteobacteria bacterium]|nr:MAG: cell envelope integrity protein CreD [Betaproteobacteria bacterium]
MARRRWNARQARPSLLGHGRHHRVGSGRNGSAEAGRGGGRTPGPRLAEACRASPARPQIPPVVSPGVALIRPRPAIWRRHTGRMNRALLLKTFVVAALALLLMVPVVMIQSLVAERQARANEAIAGIAEGWGKRQTVAGPYIALPYERRWTEVKRDTVDGKARETRTERMEWQVLRLPAAALDWTVDADIGEKARGIYRARLYTARLAATGSIAIPGRGGLEDGTSRYKWGTPRLVLGVSDALGIRAAPDLAVSNRKYPFSPGTADPNLSGGLHAPLDGLDLSRAQTLTFSLSLELGGSEAFALAPLGADTTVAMRADWPHPSFQGRYLPARHEIDASGFRASWKVSRFAASGAEGANCAFPCSRLSQAIAVSFIEPVGLYQSLERASKYGFLFLGLTFAAFMLVELLRRLAIHPIQYTLVGLALAMFFLLLVALSEHIAFAAAYAVATAACVGVITIYLVRVLESAMLGLAFGAALAGLYGMLFALLKAEDYALLGGSVLLFALLAAVMVGTRHVGWYGLRQAGGA